jgi:hypothetical protein
MQKSTHKCGNDIRKKKYLSAGHISDGKNGRILKDHLKMHAVS